MNKRIVICSDGTWNRPEEDLGEDTPTNVLRMARAVKPVASDGLSQQVFYDWGIGSYYDQVIGGTTGKGINKNIKDGYRYIVQNYRPGDEIYLFGFSRGAYTVRSLAGLINNIGILKRPDARLIEDGFKHYKKTSKAFAPEGDASLKFRGDYSHASRKVAFLGVWDTVGSLGIPMSVMGILDANDEFYDTKIGRNVGVARHAIAIDEKRSDFEPTIIEPRKQADDVKQVWFAGCHSDIGGGLKPDRGGGVLSDHPLRWMIKEASKAGLSVEKHLKDELTDVATAKLHPSRKKIFRLRPKHVREIEHKKPHTTALIHDSVRRRWNSRSVKYEPKNLKKYLDKVGGWDNAKVVTP
jgi:uncharacterized protein (DUF2235 family)